MKNFYDAHKSSVSIIKNSDFMSTRITRSSEKYSDTKIVYSNYSLGASGQSAVSFMQLRARSWSYPLPFQHSSLPAHKIETLPYNRPTIRDS